MKSSVFASTVQDRNIERKINVITEKSERADKVNVSDSTSSLKIKQNSGDVKINEECSINQIDIKSSGYLERNLQRILQRENDWEDSDLEIEEFSYFVTAKKAKVGPGTFEEFGIILEERIQNARSKYLKEKPTATNSEVVSSLVK